MGSTFMSTSLVKLVFHLKTHHIEHSKPGSVGTSRLMLGYPVVIQRLVQTSGLNVRFSVITVFPFVELPLL